MIILLCILPCWAIHLNTEHILVALGQDREIARISGRYALIFMPALPVSSVNTTFRYSVRPVMTILADNAPSATVKWYGQPGYRYDPPLSAFTICV
jgi:hypothetical protein